MSDTTVKAKVAVISGQGLSWAVTKALGHVPVMTPEGVAYYGEDGSLVHPRYTDDDMAGRLIAWEFVSVVRPFSNQMPPVWRAVMDSKTKPRPHVFQPVVAATGKTLGEAVCRAVVLSRMGEEEIDLPEGLA